MPKNYRPICLLSVIFKLLQKLLLKRLEYRLESYHSKMQMAFRKNRSTQKSLFIRGGFNFQRRQDMMVSTRPAMVGFSWGLGFRISKFQLNYSRATYHLAGASNIFSFSTNLSSFGL